MEEIIKKAIEGGWRAFNHSSGNYIDYGWQILVTGDRKDIYQICMLTLARERTSILIPKSDIVCDSLFWQALGYSSERYSTKEYMEADGFLWLKYALRFHEINLTKGWDKAVAYLQEVTK